MICMKRRNLEKAVVLGLILGCIASPVFAEDEVTTSEFVTGKHTDGSAINGVTIDGNVINVNDNVIVNGTGTGNDQQWEPGKTISVDSGVDLTLNKVWLQNANITGNGDITINSTNGTPVWISANIEADCLTLNTNAGAGISTYDNSVNLDVNKLFINAKTNGILTQAVTSKKMTVTINDTQIVDINTSAIGIQITNNADFSMISEKEGSIINVMSGNGVTHSSSLGESTLKADYINIGAWEAWGGFSW